MSGELGNSIDEIAKKITTLYNAIRVTSNTSNDTARKINDILIYGEKIPLNLLALAWEKLAAKNGIA